MTRSSTSVNYLRFSVSRYLTHRAFSFGYEVTLAKYYCQVGVTVPHRSIYIEAAWTFGVNLNVHVAFNLFGKIHFCVLAVNYNKVI